MAIRICFAAQKNCYALSWSYGEICVGCGCCAKKVSPIRNKARYIYWLDEWENHLNFNYWSDALGLRAIQEKNHKLNHKYISSRMKRYGQKVLRDKLLVEDDN